MDLDLDLAADDLSDRGLFPQFLKVQFIGFPKIGQAFFLGFALSLNVQFRAINAVTTLFLGGHFRSDTNVFCDILLRPILQ
jgi:hypothetical protein